VGLSILLFGALTYLFSKKDYTDERWRVLAVWADRRNS
jgi:hypothetical protein